MTALHTAASHGSVGVCRLLLDRGSDIRMKDEEDMTPLHFAAMEGHLGKICSPLFISSKIKIWVEIPNLFEWLE